MRARAIKEMDWLEIPRFRAQYSFDWKFPEKSERIATGCVVEDDSGETLALCVAELIPSVTLAIDQKLHPLVRLRAGKMIQEHLASALKDYPEMHCEVPPELVRGYGRHLERIFGWQAMWKGYKLKGIL